MVASRRDNRNCARRSLGSESSLTAGSNYGIDRQPNELSRECGQPIRVSFGVPVLDQDILSLDVAKFAKPLAQSGYARRVGRFVADSQVSNPRNFVGLLCMCRDAKQKEHRAKCHAEGFFQRSSSNPKCKTCPERM
jgi:hypothetical protein